MWWPSSSSSLPPPSPPPPFFHAAAAALALFAALARPCRPSPSRSPGPGSSLRSRRSPSLPATAGPGRRYRSRRGGFLQHFTPGRTPGRLLQRAPTRRRRVPCRRVRRGRTRRGPAARRRMPGRRRRRPCRCRCPGPYRRPRRPARCPGPARRAWGCRHRPAPHAVQWRGRGERPVGGRGGRDGGGGVRPGAVERRRQGSGSRGHRRPADHADGQRGGQPEACSGRCRRGRRTPSPRGPIRTSPASEGGARAVPEGGRRPLRASAARRAPCGRRPARPPRRGVPRLVGTGGAEGRPGPRPVVRHGRGRRDRQPPVTLRAARSPPFRGPATVLLVGHHMSFCVRARVCVTLADVTARPRGSRWGGRASSPARSDRRRRFGPGRFRPARCAVRTAPGRLPSVSAALFGVQDTHAQDDGPSAWSWGRAA